MQLTQDGIATLSLSVEKRANSVKLVKLFILSQFLHRRERLLRGDHFRLFRPKKEINSGCFGLIQHFQHYKKALLLNIPIVV
jgi:hypothetical protein